MDVRLPDGTIIRNVPDGMTRADLTAKLKANGYDVSKLSPQPEAPNVDPTGTTGQNIAAGAGKALADAGRGVVQRSAEMLSNAPNTLPLLKGLNVALEALGMSPTQASAEAKAQTKESRRLDKPLMDTKAGIAGNLAGNVAMFAPTAAVAGANTVPGAGVLGGLMGLIQPTENATETAVNTGVGAAGGALTQYGVNKLPPALGNRINAAQAGKAANAQKFAAAQAGAKEGYVVPPADLEPGMLTEALSGLSGKIKTAQTASQKNQQVTDRLARRALGLGEGDELTAATLQAIRDKAATQGYAPIRNAGMVQADQQFFKALDNIAQTQQGAARSFPGLADNGVVDLIEQLKRPAFDAGDAIDATRVLRASADKAYRQGDKTLGKANKAAADAIEDVLDRHLKASGQADALAAFREARQTIAKTYSVQSGLNSQTGSVSAQNLAKQLQKGKPLSGELRTAAEMGQAFPKATQSLTEAPKALSPLDFAVAMTTGAATTNPLAVAMLGARPAARAALLSGPWQQRAIQQSSGAGMPFTQGTQRLLENRLAQLMLSPAGASVSTQVAQ